MQDYLGQIQLFVGPVNNYGWLDCDGREMDLRENSDLYSILGTTYGGDGQTNFKLPKLDSPGAGARYLICVDGEYPVMR